MQYLFYILQTTTNTNYEVVTVSQPVVETVVTTTEYESSTVSLEPVSTDIL